MFQIMHVHVHVTPGVHACDYGHYYDHHDHDHSSQPWLSVSHAVIHLECCRRGASLASLTINTNCLKSFGILTASHRRPDLECFWAQPGLG